MDCLTSLHTLSSILIILSFELYTVRSLLSILLFLSQELSRSFLTQVSYPVVTAAPVYKRRLDAFPVDEQTQLTNLLASFS